MQSLNICDQCLTWRRLLLKIYVTPVIRYMRAAADSSYYCEARKAASILARFRNGSLYTVYYL